MRTRKARNGAARTGTYATPEAAQVAPAVAGGSDAAAELSRLGRVSAVLGAYDAIYRTSFWYPPYQIDTLISSKTYQIFDDELTMAAIRAPANVKRYAVLYKGWNVVPAVSDPNAPGYDQAKELADAVTLALSSIEDEGDLCQDFRQVLFEALSACHYGFSVTEVLWRVIEAGPLKGKYGFRRFAAKPCKQIGFDVDRETLAVRNIVSYTPLEGYRFTVPVEKVILYTYNPQNGLPYGSGDGRACYKHYWVLDNLQKWWAIALERWGAPVMVAKYPAGNTSALANAQTALDSVRQGSAAVLPSNIEYELVQLGENVLQAFQDAAQWHEQQCAYNILCQTLTTSQGDPNGSWALGKVHQDTQEYALGFVRRDLEDVITRQVIRRFVRYNYGDAALALCPRLSLGDWDSEDRLNVARALSMLLDRGVLFRTEKQIREQMGLAPMDPESARRQREERSVDGREGRRAVDEAAP